MLEHCSSSLRFALFALLVALVTVSHAVAQERAFARESEVLDGARSALQTGSSEPIEPWAAEHADLLPTLIEQLALNARTRDERDALATRVRAACAADRSGLLTRHAARWRDLLAQPFDAELAHADELAWSKSAGDAHVEYGVHMALAETLARAGWLALAAEHACGALDVLDRDHQPAQMLCAARDRLEWVTSWGLPFEQAQVRERVGHALQVLDQPRESMHELQAVLELALRRPDSQLALRALHIASWSSAGARGPQSGLELAQQAERVALRRRDDDAVVRALRTQGALLLTLQDEARARAVCVQSIEQAHARGLLEREADALTYLAQIEARAGRVDAAREALARASLVLEAVPQARAPEQLELHRSTRLRCALEQTRIELRDSPAPLALARVAQVEQLLAAPFDLHAHGMLQLALAEHCARAGLIARAARLSQVVVDEARRLNHAEFEARGLVKLADCSARERAEEVALRHLRAALVLRDSSQRPHLELSVEGAFERSRTASSDSSFGALIAAQGFERSGDERFAQEALALIDYGRARTLAARQLPSGALSVLTASELKRRLAQRLSPSTLMIAFDTRAALAVACRAGRFRLYRTPSIEQLAHLVDFFEHSAWVDPDIASFAPAARALSEALFAPLRDELQGVSELVVVADGPLHRIPFELLLDPRSEPQPRSFATAAFLFRAFDVVHAPYLGLGEHVAARTAAQAPQRLVAFGYGGPEPSLLAPLAEHEVRAVSALYEPSQRWLRVGEQASEAEYKRVELRSGDVLHIAAHGSSGSAGLRSAGLTLAAGDGDDGQVTLRELCARPAPVDVVLLSACNGSVGREVDAEGVLSSAWALLYAGARSAIVATAPIDDRLGERLSVRVHRRLLEGLGPAAALAGARRELLASADALDIAAARLPFLVQQRLP